MLKTALSLIFNTNRTLEVGDGGVTFEAFITEEHSKSMKLTEIVVENGSIINDHSIMMPRKLNIRAITSNTPIYYGGAMAKNIVQAKAGYTGSSSSAIDWQVLIEVLEEREPLSIVTVSEAYNNMVLTDIGTSTDKDTSEVLIVDMVFQEFRTVNVVEEEISASKIKDDSVSTQASKNQSQGVKPTKESNDTILKGFTR